MSLTGRSRRLSPGYLRVVLPPDMVVLPQTREHPMKICANCRKRVFKVRNPGPSGAWYHSHTASVSCYPGAGSEKRADPVEVELPAQDRQPVRA